MRTCCFCFDLKGGATASAVFTLVINIKAIIGIIITLVLIDQTWNKVDRFGEVQTTPDPYKSDAISRVIHIILWTVIGVSALIIVTSVLLLIAIQKGTRALFFPWVVVMGLQVGASLVVACILIPTVGFDLLPVLLTPVCLVVGAFYSYMIWCVSAFYNTLSAPAAMPYQRCGVENHHVQFQDGMGYSTEKDVKPLV